MSCLKKELIKRKNISFLKNTEIVRKRPDTNYCQVLGRAKFARFSHAPKIHLREAENLKKAIVK